MKTTIMLFVLCSAFCGCTRSRLRHLTFRKEGVTRDAAVETCQKCSSSLVTLYDEDDARVICNFVQNQTNAAKTVWLGLRRNKTTTHWSDGTPYNENIKLQHGEQKCDAIVNSNITRLNCSEKLHFICRKNNNNTPVHKKKDWCQAQQYCRRHFADMVSFSNEIQKQELLQISENQSFWIGLMHDEWKWDDRTCSTFRLWGSKEKYPSLECTTQSILTQSPLWLNVHGCDNNEATVCSKGSVRIIVVKLNYTWEQAFDYCEEHHTRLLWIQDRHDQCAVKQWLEHSEVPGPVWLGLRQSHLFGFWIWTTDMVVDFSQWKNATQPELPLSHNCGAIAKDDEYKWSDKDCRLQLYFLCEEEFLPTRGPPVPGLAV